ncbi:helix-turn-helix transcriptional regulator [Paenibacillus silviterrae]|uniref:helix-turn-helix transcriptional regulator n=1 Tax=Paenibacillus silviterrae TaxID=3242194 RepID=UPI0025435342|nr:AraC family transcriptional regulator [Paenibacillus chinjuensis]
MSDLSIVKYAIEDNDFSIHYTNLVGQMRGPHAHPSYEILYVMEGERIFFLNETVYLLQKGDMILINPNDPHRSTSSEASKCERILVNFTDAFIQPELARARIHLLPQERPSRIFRFSVNEQAAVEELLRRMIHECQGQEEGCSAFVRASLTQLLVLMHRNERKQSQRFAHSSHPMHQKVSEIAAYVVEHYATGLTLNDVARRFYISPSYLSRIFRSITGFHFKEYLQLVRIREAKRLLRETSIPIGAVAEATGFEHTANFNVTFKKITGSTPGHYRKSTR